MGEHERADAERSEQRFRPMAVTHVRPIRLMRPWSEALDEPDALPALKGVANDERELHPASTARRMMAR